MKIFLSWSGNKSRLAASALKDWLPLLVHTADVWMSEHDIEAGSRWSNELSSRLEACDFGIICVTPENVSAPWLLFESGCLGKSVSQSRVIPYRLGIEPASVPYPLAQFQSVSADREGRLKLLRSIVATNSTPLDQSRLEILFKRLWPDLQNKIEQASKYSEAQHPQRPDRQLLEELVEVVRGVAQRSDEILERMGFSLGAPQNLIRIDPRPPLGAGARTFAVPFRSEQTVSDFSDMVWCELNRFGHVAAYTWGTEWMLLDKRTGQPLEGIGTEYFRIPRREGRHAPN